MALAAGPWGGGGEYKRESIRGRVVGLTVAVSLVLVNDTRDARFSYFQHGSSTIAEGAYGKRYFGGGEAIEIRGAGEVFFYFLYGIITDWTGCNSK